MLYGSITIFFDILLYKKSFDIFENCFQGVNINNMSVFLIALFKLLA